MIVVGDFSDHIVISVRGKGIATDLVIVNSFFYKSKGNHLVTYKGGTGYFIIVHFLVLIKLERNRNCSRPRHISSSRSKGSN